MRATHDIMIDPARLETLYSNFSRAYPTATRTLVVRAPGRVNLIGEHIDYCGMSVLPMAIHRDLIICAGTRPSSGQPATSPPRILAESIGYNTLLNVQHPVQLADIDISKLAWTNYFLAAYKGAVDHLKLVPPAPGTDLCFLIHSIVPAGSGLSSSSALIVAVILATAALSLGSHGLANIPKTTLCTVAIESERLVGVNSGGMDQSISLLATCGAAGLVHFRPALRLDPIPLPHGLVFVIAHSLVTADKHASASRHYNLRVLETRLAAALLAKSQLLRPEMVLSDFVNTTGGPEAILSELFEMEAEAVKLLPKSATVDQVAKMLSTPVSALYSHYIQPFPVHFEALNIQDRAVHVFSEARRVWLVAQLLLSKTPHSQYLPTIGQLMADSHASCRDLFECSCPELDELVRVCTSAGSLGSRLTGAGWGGCTVSLLASADQVDPFIEAVYAKYYLPRNIDREVALSQYIFASTPSQGASTHWDFCDGC